MQNEKTFEELLNERATLAARLSQLPYQGTTEIKHKDNNRYVYVRKRVAGKLTSRYVGPYSEELYEVVLRSTHEAQELNKRIKHIERDLFELGYVEKDLPAQIVKNLDYARANMKLSIYDQAILEGVATSFPQTEAIIDNGVVYGVSATDVQKVLNLKHAWEFILDKDIIQSPASLGILQRIASLVNEGFLTRGGEIRSLPVRIGGTEYIPPIPHESDVVDKLGCLTAQKGPAIALAIELCLYIMRSQLFLDGNKRAAILFANFYLIQRGAGLLVVPERLVGDFKDLLIEYYETGDPGSISMFLNQNCYSKL